MVFSSFSRVTPVPFFCDEICDEICDETQHHNNNAQQRSTTSPPLPFSTTNMTSTSTTMTEACIATLCTTMDIRRCKKHLVGLNYTTWDDKKTTLSLREAVYRHLCHTHRCEARHPAVILRVLRSGCRRVGTLPAVPQVPQGELEPIIHGHELLNLISTHSVMCLTGGSAPTVTSIDVDSPSLPLLSSALDAITQPLVPPPPAMAPPMAAGTVTAPGAGHPRWLWHTEGKRLLSLFVSQLPEVLAAVSLMFNGHGSRATLDAKHQPWPQLAAVFNDSSFKPEDTFQPEDENAGDPSVRACCSDGTCVVRTSDFLR
jgi:hypothetical protein